MPSYDSQDESLPPTIIANEGPLINPVSPPIVMLKGKQAFEYAQL